MEKVAVVYQSKYGSTEKYANWIAKSVGADLYRAKETKIGALLPYDTLVYCGGMYAGGILGFSLVQKNYEKLSGKKLIVVAVGATLKKAEAVPEVKNQNLPPIMRDKVLFFLLRGGLNYKKMHCLDRLLMYLRVRLLKAKRPEELDDDSKGVIGTYGKVVDFTSKRSIEPIVQAIRGIAD